MNTTNRRQVLKLAGAAGLALPALIRPRPSWAQSNVLNITTYDKFLPQDFIDKFQKDTGIQVNIRLTDEQSKVFNLLAAEAGNPSTDIATVLGHRLEQFTNAKLLAPFDPGKLSNWKNLNPAHQDAAWARLNGSLWGVPILAGYGCLTRNTTYVPDEPPSWDIMFDPKYKGFTSYVVSDFMIVSLYYLGHDFSAFTSDPTPDSEFQKWVNEARDLLIKNKQMVRKYHDSGSEVQQMFLNEDIYLASSWSGPASTLIMEGAPIKQSIPKEGTYGLMYMLNIANNAPNQENAYKLLDAILATPEVGAAMTRSSGFSSTFSGVAELLTERERLALTLPQEQVERIKFSSAFNFEKKIELIEKAAAEVKAA